jgi:gamma-glutamyltranspeptidase/glutathione hydrolase
MLRLVLLLLLAASPALAQRQMVVAAHPLAAEAGMAALRAGGNALDAAVAVQAMLAVVEPQASGLAGGAFLLHWDAGAQKLAAWDGRESAPAAASPGLFLRDGRPLPFEEAAVGGRPVGVPGVLRMLEAAHKAGGKLPWSSLFAGAAVVAEAGFPVSPRLAGLLVTHADRLARDAEARAVFLPGGRPLAVGATMKNPALAATLRAVAEQGADALHRGPIAGDIANAVRADPNPGLMTTDDLAGYAPRRREAICARYRGRWTICGMPPPSSGGTAVLQILGLLATQDMAALAPGRPGDPRALLDAAHLLGEAGRLAFADRNRYLGDPDRVAVPLAGLLDARYLLLRAQLIDRDSAIVTPRPGNPLWQDSQPLASQPPQPEDGTSHVSIFDAAGHAVALTTTIEAPFGAHLMVRGMLLNNELTDFSFLPEIAGRPVANAVAGGKRPRSSMAPTIVFGADGRPAAVLGSAGGGRIISHVAQTLIALLDWDMPPQEAVGLPRLGALNATLEVEAGTSAATLAPGLTERGFPTETVTNTSGLHVIRILRGPQGIQLLGGADPRRDGAVAAE